MRDCAVLAYDHFSAFRVRCWKVLTVLRSLHTSVMRHSEDTFGYVVRRRRGHCGVTGEGRRVEAYGGSGRRSRVAGRRRRVVARHLADDRVGLVRVVRVRGLEAVHAAEGRPGAVPLDDVRLSGGEGLWGLWRSAMGTRVEEAPDSAPMLSRRPRRTTVAGSARWRQVSKMGARRWRRSRTPSEGQRNSPGCLNESMLWFESVGELMFALVYKSQSEGGLSVCLVCRGCLKSGVGDGRSMRSCQSGGSLYPHCLAGRRTPLPDSRHS